MKSRINKVQIIQGSILIFTIVLGFLTVEPLKQAADRRAENLKNELIGQIEESLGITIRYRSISPALLSIVTIRGLSVTFDKGDFTAERVRVFYRPLRRLSGNENDPIKLITRIAVSDSNLNLSLVTPDDGDGKEKGKSFDPWPLLVDKSVDINNFSIRIVLDDSTFLSADDVSLLMKEDKGAVRYSLDGLLYASGSGGLEKFGEIETSISSTGRYSPGSSTVNGRLDLKKAGSNLIDLKPFAVDFTFTGKKLTARRIDDSIPLDLAFNYSDEGWSLNGEAVGLSFRQIALPGSDVGSWDPWFSSVIDGKFSFVSQKKPENLKYVVNLDLIMQADPLPWDLKAELDLSGTEKTAEIDLIRLSSEWGDVLYTGSFGINELAPNGQFSFKLGAQLLSYPVSAVFNLTTENDVISAEPVLFEAAGLDFEDFRFLIIREPNIYALSLLVVPGREGEDDDTVRRLTIDGLLDTSASPVFHGFTSIQGLDSTYLTNLFGIDALQSLPIIKNSLFNMEGYFEANQNTWTFSVNEAELKDRENPENYVFFKGRGSPGSISIDRLRVSWNEYLIDSRGFGQRTKNGGIAQARILIGETLYPLDAEWFSDGTIQVESGFGFNASLGKRTVNGRSLQFVGDDISIPLKNGILNAVFDVRGRVARNDWDLYINKTILNITERENLSDVSLSLNGRVNPDSIVIPDIILNDDLGMLKGNAYFKSSDQGKNLNGRFFLGSKDSESYEVSLYKSEDSWDVDVDIQSAQMKRLDRNRIEGRLSVTGRMRGTMDNPVISLNLSTADGLIDGQPVEAHSLLSMESGRLRIQDLYYEYEGLSFSRGLVLVNMNNGTLRSTAELNATFNQVPVSSGFALAMDFGRSFTLPELPELADSGFKGTLATRSVLWDSKEHLPSFTFQFEKNDELFHVQTPDGKILNAQYAFDSGKLSIIAEDPLPFNVKGGGTVKDGKLDLSFPELSLDPVLINYAMFRDPILLQYHVVFQSGSFSGNLDIKGPINNPSIDGEILADKLLVDTPYTYADIQPASTRIHFRNHRIDVDTLEIPIGDGIVYADGYILLDRLKLVDFDMTYGGKATGAGLGVPVYYPLMGVNLDGVFIGEVRMTGGNHHFSLNGDITFPYLKASLGSAIIPVTQTNEGKYPATVDLDFNFITGKNCTFYLPNEQLKIVKAIAESDQIISFKYSKSPLSMSIKGLLPVKSGDIYYFDRDFQIIEGSLLFDETLGNFNPILSLRAETKVRDDQGTDVTVALVYDSPVMSDFTPEIETFPPRSEHEVMALFGQAVALYGESQDTDAATTMLLATGGMFGQVGIVQPFEEVLREGLNLDMVTIRTDIIENTIAEGLSRGGTADSDAHATGLGKYLDNTSLFAGKYIGDALFISGTVSANYFESQRLRSVFGGLEFETSVSLEMETPFFNVAWSYSPDPTRNQNFVADNEISLKWRFTY